MGKYAGRLSERLLCLRKKDGFCLICNLHKPLSEDHVPPQCAVHITRTEQKQISEMFENDSVKIKGAISKNGNKFKTICRECNSSLSVGDTEIGKVCKDLTKKIKHHFTQANGTSNIISASIDSKKYIQSMAGHILAATSEVECQKKQQSSPYFDPIRRFVLGESESIDETHDIYYWFYPYNRHISAKILSFHNKGNNCIVSLLSFFPIAFLITEKGKGIYPAHAMRLNSSCDRLLLDLSYRNINYAEFPFVTLEGQQFYMMKDYTCTVSYPIK